MKKSEYRSLLGQLPIKNPTHEDLARFCPHLTKEQAVKSLQSERGVVACPSLYIRNGYQILCYYKEWTETVTIYDPVTDNPTTVTKNHPPMLSWLGSGRTIQSYKDGKPHGDVFYNYKHIAEAINFANKNWGDELVIDDWEAVMEIYLQDPSDLVTDRYHRNDPRTKMVIYLALNRDYNEIINDRSKPEHEQLGAAVTQITNDRLIWSEIKGGRGGYTEFSCAYCGSGLNLDHCKGCGHRFRDNLFRCGWYTPLPKKVTDYIVSQGHSFTINPEISVKRALEKWNKLKQ